MSNQQKLANSSASASTSSAPNSENLQAQHGTEAGTSGTYSSLAEKTVANIRRLQENVGNPVNISANNTTTVWVGNHQVVPDNVQQPLGSPSNAFQQVRSSPQKSGSKNPSTPPHSPLPVISPTLTSSFNALVTIDPNWQTTKKSVRERNAVMCNNALMANVYFSVGSEFGNPKRFPGHKYVLATGSTVFYAMFFGGLADEKDLIEVPDVEPDAFLTMLRYLYCDEIVLDNNNVLATLYCAKKYIVPHLASECIRFLENSLTAKNACVLLSQSRLFEEPELMERCWEVIDAQSQMALLSDSFTDIDHDTLGEILSRETLNCKETAVFQAAQNWSSAECKKKDIPDTPENRRNILGDEIMKLIRFPSMKMQDFADYVVNSGILSLQETTDIFMHFTAKEKPEVIFQTSPRIGLKMQTCQRFQSSAYRSNQWRYQGRCDSIQFCVDRRIFVVGFGLYGSSNGSSDYTAKIQLKSHCENGITAENASKFFSDGSSNTFKVFFKQPVQIEPDTFYTASVILDGPELSYFGQEGMTEVSVGTVTFQFQCSLESTNGTGVQGGQIPELIFYGPNLSPQLSSEVSVESSASPIEGQEPAMTG